MRACVRACVRVCVVLLTEDKNESLYTREKKKRKEKGEIPQCEISRPKVGFYTASSADRLQIGTGCGRGSGPLKSFALIRSESRSQALHPIQTTANKRRRRTRTLQQTR